MSGEIEEFVETRFCKLCVILPSQRELRAPCNPMKETLYVRTVVVPIYSRRAPANKQRRYIYIYSGNWRYYSADYIPHWLS